MPKLLSPKSPVLMPPSPPKPPVQDCDYLRLDSELWSKARSGKLNLYFIHIIFLFQAPFLHHSTGFSRIWNKWWPNRISKNIWTPSSRSRSRPSRRCSRLIKTCILYKLIRTQLYPRCSQRSKWLRCWYLLHHLMTVSTFRTNGLTALTVSFLEATAGLCVIA